MTAKSPEKQPAPKGRQEQAEFLSAVGRRVLDTLGQPDDLYSVLVRWLWDDHYRVNVVVGGDPTSVKIAHSFFLETDNLGNIIACNPRITKHYTPRAQECRGDTEPRGA